MALVGRTHPAEAGDAVTDEADGWPDGWTDDELRALAADSDPDDTPACSRRGLDVKTGSIG